MRHFFAFFLVLFFAGAAHAQTQVQFGLQTSRPGTPRALGVYDQTNAFVPFASVDSAGHTLTFTGPATLSSLTISGYLAATTSGTLINGHCVSINAAGNLVDAGGACSVGGGGGTVSAASAGQLAYYASAGNVVSGATTGTGVLAALGNTAGAAGGFATYNQFGAAMTFQNPASGSVSRTTTSKLSDFVNIDDFGGSRSSATATCSTVAGSATISCGSNDFLNGNGIRINHAGAAFGIGATSGPTIVPCGTNPFGSCSTGTATKCYRIVVLDGAGGYSSASPEVCTSTSPNTLSIANFNKVAWTNPGGANFYAIYGGAAGAEVLLDYTYNQTWNDYGHSARKTEDWLPATPPSVAAADWLLTTVSSNGGTTAPTLSSVAQQTVASVSVLHDNGPNFAAAFAANNKVFISCGSTAYQMSGLGFQMASGQTLEGYSEYCPAIVLTTGTISNPAIVAYGATGIKISGVGINAAGYTSSQGVIGFRLTTNSYITHNNISNFLQFGIAINAGSNVYIENNTISIATASSEFNDGINVSNASGVAFNFYITGNTITNTDIDVSIATATISKNTIIGYGFGGGIVTEQDPNSGSYTITDNYIVAGLTVPDTNATCPNGIENWGAYSIISNNKVSNACGGGLAMGGKFSVITNNRVMNNTGCGIGMRLDGATYNGQYSIVEGNVALYTGGPLVQTYGYCENSGGVTDSYVTLGPNSFAGNSLGGVGAITGTIYQKSPSLKTSTAWNFAIANGQSLSNNVFMKGLVSGSTCSVNHTAQVAGVIFSALSQTNNLQLSVTNSSGSSQSLTGTVYVTCELPGAY